MPDNECAQWATVDLMGHAQTGGRVTMENGLLRVDVPDGDSFRTEFYGMAAIYSIKIVSEEIARAYVKPTIDHYVYDAPIITREEHMAIINRLERGNEQLRETVREFQRRLTAIKALPAPNAEDGELPF